jgi:hypothetical protein
MLRHIGLMAAFALSVMLPTQSLQARGGGHRGHGGFARGFAPGYFMPSFSPAAGTSSSSTSRRSARPSRNYATASTASTGSTSSTNGSWSSRHKSNTSANSSTNTPTNATNTSLQTPAVGTVGVNPLGLLPYASTSLDPNVTAQRTYGYLLRNARQLIQAGLYAPAANYLQRIIAGAPGTRIAAEAQQLLMRLPVI